MARSKVLSAFLAGMITETDTKDILLFRGHRRRKVKVLLRGGLGNQLFQIQLGLELTSLGREVLFDDTFLRPGWHHKSRPLRSTNYAKTFGLPVTSSSPISTWILKRLFLGIAYYLATKLRSGKIAFGPLLSSHNAVNVAEANGKFLVDVPGMSNPLDPKALEAVRRLLLQKLADSPLESQKSFIGVHVRRGDYVDLEEIYGRICIHYFQKSLKVCKSLTRTESISKVVLFTDSPEMVDSKALMKDSDHKLYFASELKLEVLDEFRQLVGAAAIIGSNSSFSWWAAALSSAVVIMPTPFEGPNLMLPQYVMNANWERVSKCKQC